MLDPNTEEIVNGWILHFLSTDPKWTRSDGVLLSMLSHAGLHVSRIDLNHQIEFLAGPGNELVSIHKKNNESKWVKLAPKGSNLLAGRIDVPGVTPPFQV